MQKSMVYLDRVRRRFKNQECILDKKHPKSRISIIELSDSDDDNSVNNFTTSSTESSNLQMATSLNIFLNDTVEPLNTTQKKLCKGYLSSKKAKLVTENEQLKNIRQDVDEKLLQIYRNLYKFDSQQKFKFDEEISIVDIHEPVDNDVAIVSTIELPGLPDDLPVRGKLLRHLLKLGDKVYAMKHSQLQPWVEATIKSALSDTYFNIIFEDGEETVMNYKNLAYINTSNVQYPVGSRVIAKFQDMNIQLTDKFYVGVIAEPPKYLNNFRYV